jgi:hypothetical protein
MVRHAVFVDLPNFYSHLVRSAIGSPDMLRHYFLNWLDFDCLAGALTGDFCPVWVFHSGRRLGPSTARVDGKCLTEYIHRINSLTGVTAYDVDIEGSQREFASYECEKCGHKGVAQWESEKGIDASLTVHLFDTMDTWDTAYLLSADADFVPAVRTLRRRGKVVVGAGFSERSSALVRECYAYIDLYSAFLEDDTAAYEMFRDGGLVQAWLAAPVHQQEGVAPGELDLTLTATWQGPDPDTLAAYGAWWSMREVSGRVPWHSIGLHALGHVGQFDFSSREQEVRRFQAAFPRHVRQVDFPRPACLLAVSPSAWHSVERRLDTFAASLPGASVEGPSSTRAEWKIAYQYDPNARAYDAVPPEPGP